VSGKKDSKVVTLRFNEDDYQEIIREAGRYKITVSAYLRSCALMRIAGDLIEKKVADDEYVSKYSTMKNLDDRGTF
jgi:uncharacterized protein YmfQ (DUF2313 family)